LAHDDQTFDGLLQFSQALLEHSYQNVVSVDFLVPKDLERVRDVALFVHEGLRQVSLDVFGESNGDFIRTLAFPLLAARSRAHGLQCLHEVLDDFLLAGDVGVLVQTEDFRVVVQRHLVDHLPHAGKLQVVGRVVLPRGREVVNAGHYLRIHVRLEERLNEPHVLIVGDTPAIVDLGDDHVQRLVRDDCLRVHVLFDLQVGSVEVRVHPVVGDVPADGAEFAPLQNYGVEEGQREEQLLELARLVGGVVELVLDLVVGPRQVGLKAFGRLVGELDAGLEHGHRELGRGHAGQPQAVQGVNLRLVLVLLDLLQRLQPADGQVAVLQADPVAVASAAHDVLSGFLALSLPERQDLQFFKHALGPRQFEEVAHWVGAR